MLRRTLLRPPRPVRTNILSNPVRRSTAQSTSTSTSTAPQPPPQVSRIARLEARLPRFLQHITRPLRHAPVSHITAFLLLHEITAIAPLFGLVALFHYSNWLPPFISEGKWFNEGMQRFGKWLRKRGWIEDDGGRGGKWWGRGEGGVRLLVEFATAYTVVKALLPVRLVLSVWATPWFARWSVLPVTNFVRKRFGWGKIGVGATSGGAGTGAVGGGVLPKETIGKVK